MNEAVGETPVADDQIRSRERVRDLAEVYTAEREVRAMLDLVPDALPSAERPAAVDDRFLEPACGSGNFLVEVLARKLAHLGPDGDPASGAGYEELLVRALASVYAVDVDASNVAESRARLRALALDSLAARSLEPSPGLAPALDAVLAANVVRADTLTDAPDLLLPDYHPLGGGLLLREWVPLDEGGASEGDLFFEVASRRRSDGAPLRYLDLGAHPGPTPAPATGAATPPARGDGESRFTVVVGNPPYQVAAAKEVNTTADARPIYQHFVERAIDLGPRHVVMITPSRWFTGGKASLGTFRSRMVADRRLARVVHLPDARDAFPGVEVRGGVSYFLWSASHDGDVLFSTSVRGEVVSTVARDLRGDRGIVVRDARAVPIVERVLARGLPDASTIVSRRDPFGNGGPRPAHASRTPFEGAVPVVYRDEVLYVERGRVARNRSLVDRWKVIVPKASDGGGGEVHHVLGTPIALAPGSACSETYLLAGTFGTEAETRNYAEYLTTRFARFLVLQRKPTQNMTSDAFRFVPLVDLTRPWSDAELYEEFGLTEDERAYVEASIRERSVNYSLDSPVPASHAPGARRRLDPGAGEGGRGPALEPGLFEGLLGAPAG